MVLSVRKRVHWGTGLFCFCFFDRMRLVRKLLWEGWLDRKRKEKKKKKKWFTAAPERKDQLLQCHTWGSMRCDSIWTCGSHGGKRLTMAKWKKEGKREREEKMRKGRKKIFFLVKKGTKKFISFSFRFSRHSQHSRQVEGANALLTRELWHLRWQPLQGRGEGIMLYTHTTDSTISRGSKFVPRKKKNTKTKGSETHQQATKMPKLSQTCSCLDG